MSALRKLISGSSKAGACGRHILEFASHDQSALCNGVASRELHASPALQKSPGAASISQQLGRAGLRTSLPLTKPVVDRSAAPLPERPHVRIDPSLLNLRDASVEPKGSHPERENNQSNNPGDK